METSEIVEMARTILRSITKKKDSPWAYERVASPSLGLREQWEMANWIVANHDKIAQLQLSDNSRSV